MIMPWVGYWGLMLGVFALLSGQSESGSPTR